MRSLDGDVRDAAAVEARSPSRAPSSSSTWRRSRSCARSFESPVETYATNVMGTVHVLDAARRADGVRVVVNVTSDKCYENREWVWAYREDEPMGGYDPYSSSKGCAELVTARLSARSSSTATAPAIASARAGNVIGGGDWARDRLIPDVMGAALDGALGDDPQPGRDPSLAARAQPAERLPRARPGAVGLARVRRALELRARRRRRPSRALDHRAPVAGSGASRSPGIRRRATSHTRRTT